MGQARDAAGNIWETDAQGRAVRLVQPAAAARPSIIPALPPDPARVAEQEQQNTFRAEDQAMQREQMGLTRQSNARAEREANEPPSGYLWGPDGQTLVAIPGGPADTARSGKAMRQGDADHLAEQVDIYSNMTNALATFTDQFAGNTVTGRVENWAQALNSGIGTPGQRDWWSNFDAIDMQIRNKMFGASLTDSEKRSYEATTVTPSMDPSIVRSNLERRFGIIQNALRRRVGRLHSVYNKDEVEAALGEYGQFLLPGTKPANTGEREDPPAPVAAVGLPGGRGGGTGGAPRGSRGPARLTRPDTGGEMSVATGGTKSVFDPETAAGIDALVRAGRPAAEAKAFAESHGYEWNDSAAYNANVQYYRRNPTYKGSFTNATRDVPTTADEQAAASNSAAYFTGARSALTAGFDDELAGAASALTGGDYEQTRDASNAHKQIMATIRPGATLTGNVTGGVLGALGGGAALGRLAPGAVAATAQTLGRAAPVVGDAAYGALYGAGENNENRLTGGLSGAILGAGGGAAARGATRGLANVISPPAGKFGPLYEAGAFPTVGQRLGQSGLAGRAVNTSEQAMQSFPVLGALVARARQIPRDQMQLGAFNEALGEIGQALPGAMTPGEGPQQFASQAFGQAYTTARRGMQFVPDAQYMNDEAQFWNRLGNGVLNEQQEEQVARLIGNTVGSRSAATQGPMTGEMYQLAGTEFGDAIDAWGRDPTTAPMAQALRDYVSIFDNAARRNSHPAAVKLLDDADRGYAKLVRLQNAGARGGVRKDTGTFSPTDLLAAVKQEGGGVRSGAYQRGDALMQDFAEAGRGLIDTLPNSGTADRLMVGQAVAGGAGAMTPLPALIGAHPGALAPFAAYAPGMNKLVTRAIAPRQYTLPPALAARLAVIASQVEQRAPTIGRLAAPGAVAWGLGQ